MAAAVLGLRGSGGFSTSERPKNFRQMIMLLFPNGDAPLTAILSMLRSQETDDPEFSWFEKGLPVQRGIIIGADEADTSLSPAIGDIVAAADTTVEIALSVLPDGGSNFDTSWLKVGHLLYNEVTEEVFLIIQKNAEGGDDYIIVSRDVGNKFASNPAVTGNATTGDGLSIVGSGFPEGAPIGAAIAYQPARLKNFTQIFRTPLFLTRTARKTKLRWDRTGAWLEARREALQIHGLELERAFMFGERTEFTTAFTGTGSGPPLELIPSSEQVLRTTRGLINWLPAINDTTTVVSIHQDIGLAATFNGLLTEKAFEDWLEILFRNGSSTKLGFIGSTALNVLNRMAKNKMVLQAVPTDRTYGMALMEFITPFGTLLLKNHPLMSANPTWRKDIMAIDTDKLTYRYIDDTRFLVNRQSPGDDASKDEYLTEAGLEAHFSGTTSEGGGAGELPAIVTTAAHGRLRGIADYGG